MSKSSFRPKSAIPTPGNIAPGPDWTAYWTVVTGMAVTAFVIFTAQRGLLARWVALFTWSTPQTLGSQQSSGTSAGNLVTSQSPAQAALQQTVGVPPAGVAAGAAAGGLSGSQGTVAPSDAATGSSTAPAGSLGLFNSIMGVFNVTKGGGV